MKRSRWCRAACAWLALALAGPLAGHTHADADAPAENSVRVAGIRDPGMLPYKSVYALLSKARDIGGVEVIVRVVSSKTKAPVPDLEITLVGDTMSRPLELSADGILAIPLDPTLAADKADFMSNKKKRELVLGVAVVPKLPRENLRYGDIVDSIDAAQQVVAASIPWYMRVLAPSIRKVGICYPDALQAVSVAGATPAARPALAPDQDMLTKAPVYCASFTRTESGIARDSVITPAPGWKPLFL